MGSGRLTDRWHQFQLREAEPSQQTKAAKNTKSRLNLVLSIPLNGICAWQWSRCPPSVKTRPFTKAPSGPCQRQTRFRQTRALNESSSCEARHRLAPNTHSASDSVKKMFNKLQQKHPDKASNLFQTQNFRFLPTGEIPKDTITPKRR